MFSAVASDEGGDKAQVIIEGSGEALLDCHCASDVAAFRALMWRIAGNPHPNALLELTIDQSYESTKGEGAIAGGLLGSLLGFALAALTLPLTAGASAAVIAAPFVAGAIGGNPGSPTPV